MYPPHPNNPPKQKTLTAFTPFRTIVPRFITKNKSLHTVKFGIVKLDIYTGTHSLRFDSIILSRSQSCLFVSLPTFPLECHGDLYYLRLGQIPSNWISLSINNHINCDVFPKKQRFPQNNVSVFHQVLPPYLKKNSPAMRF